MSPLPRRQRRGGRGGAEPQVRIRERERQVWELAVRGHTQRAISEALGVSQPAVSKILRRLDDRHAQTLARDHARHQARRCARLDHLYAECVRGWEQSQADQVQKTQRRGEPSAGSGPPSPAWTQVRVDKRAGDPRFLREARELLVATRQLLPAPAPGDVGDSWQDLSQLTADELETLAAIRARLEARRTSTGRAIADPAEDAS